LRKGNGGKDVAWFQVPHIHQELTDKDIITKIENTVLSIRKSVEENAEKNKKASAAKQKGKKENVLDRQQSGSGIQRRLRIFACPGTTKKQLYPHLIDTMKATVKDNDLFTPLSYFMEHLDKNNIHFIMNLDWKSEIETLDGGYRRH